MEPTTWNAYTFWKDGEIKMW